ncbi:acyl carrier protein [Natronincola peptidivorans]|uniref:Acyl carrier protein n=1 Tax=Natronincola peptidivorans TaxID=426128 RepID=A0A1H9ZT11_9FIRM|nr:acyl carrier protein [Natronincola peptidivorans]SES84849.1 acyl carrier protein [Natronincola peptidivorans]
MEEKLIKIINTILKKEGRTELNNLEEDLSLRDDLGFDSLNLAELTVRIEDEFGVDIFEDDIVDKLSEIINKINGSE